MTHTITRKGFEQIAKAIRESGVSGSIVAGMIARRMADY